MNDGVPWWLELFAALVFVFGLTAAFVVDSAPDEAAIESEQVVVSPLNGG